MGVRALTLDRDQVAIHGTTAKMRASIGTAASYGCIRMLNEDVADLYDRVSVGSPVMMMPVSETRRSRFEIDPGRGLVHREPRLFRIASMRALWSPRAKIGRRQPFAHCYPKAFLPPARKSSLWMAAMRL